jgi:hypothetical protein
MKVGPMPVLGKFQIRIFKMKQLGFTHIGQTAATVTRQSLNVDGNSVGLRGAAQSLVDMQRIAKWLAGQTPAEIDKIAVSRALSHGVELRMRYETRYPKGLNGEILPSYNVAVFSEIGGNTDGVDAALTDLRKFLTPAPLRMIEGFIAELSVLVIKARDNEFSDELRVTAYAARLSRYPADIVRHVLLVQTYKFFPYWEELEKRAEALASPRRHMIMALERGIQPTPAERREATQHERDRLQALVDQLFPRESPETKAH